MRINKTSFRDPAGYIVEDNSIIKRIVKREYFDVELIMGMIRNKAFSFENFNNWSRFILNRIAKYQKPIDDEKHKKWVSDFYNKIDSREFNVSIIKFLEYSIIRVEEIEKDIKQYNENTRSI